MKIILISQKPNVEVRFLSLAGVHLDYAQFSFNLTIKESM